MHPQHRFELPVGNRGVSQVHGVRALVGMVALERKDVRILATVDQKYESGTTVGPETGVNCRSVGAMAATADNPKRYGPRPADPSRRTPPIAASRLKNEACPTASPPRECPTIRMRFRSTLPCSG